MCLQRKLLKIMCDVEKQCYVNIVFVRCTRCIVKCIDCDFINFVSKQKRWHVLKYKMIYCYFKGSNISCIMSHSSVTYLFPVNYITPPPPAPIKIVYIRTNLKAMFVSVLSARCTFILWNEVNFNLRN